MKLQKHYLLVANPISGGTDKTRIIDFAKEAASQNKVRLHLYETSGKNDADNIRSLYKKHKIDRVIVAGGDGTILLVAEALEKERATLAVVPSGSANGLAKDLDIPAGLEESISNAFEGKVIEMDMICINGKRSLHLSDIGLNAELIKNYEEGAIRGKFGYLLQTIKTLSDSEDAFHCSIEAEGEIVETEARVIIIANSQKYGTGVVINPDGKIDDGKFEVVVFKNLDLLTVGKILTGNMPLENPDIQIISTSKAKIRTQSPVNFQVDGEYCGTVEKLDITILPRHLKITVPEKEPLSPSKDPD